MGNSATLKPDEYEPPKREEKMPPWQNHQQRAEEPAIRYDGEKTRVDLMSTHALLAYSEGLTYGLKKYPARNWEKGFSWSRAYASLLRHVLLFWSGQDTDEESGLHHLALAMCNLGMLVEFTKTHPELDDRPGKPTKSARRLLYICAPWATRTPEEERETKEAVSVALKLGWAPIFVPLILGDIDDEPAQRERALQTCEAVIDACDNCLVVNIYRAEETAGMKRDLERWKLKDKQTFLWPLLPEPSVVRD